MYCFGCDFVLGLRVGKLVGVSAADRFPPDDCCRVVLEPHWHAGKLANRFDLRTLVVVGPSVVSIHVVVDCTTSRAGGRG